MKNPAGSRKTEHSTPATPWESIDPNEPAGVALLAPPTDEPEVTVYNADDVDDAPKSPRVALNSHSTSDALQRAAADLQAFNRDHEFDFTQDERPAPVVSEFVIPDEMIEALDADQSAPASKAETAQPIIENPVKLVGARRRVTLDSATTANSTPDVNEPLAAISEVSDEAAVVEPFDEVVLAEVDNEPATVLAKSNEDFGDEDDEELSEYEQAEAQRWEDPELEEEAVPVSSGAGWTIPVLCAGIALIACCVVIPQADANRRMAYEKQLLQADLESIQKQVIVNDEFLKRVMDDPSLSERLAQRQLKRVRKGQQVLHLENEKEEMSPFQIVAIAPPPPPAPYKPAGGVIASLCYEPRTRLYVMGAAMTMIASGLVMGATKSS